MISLGQFKDNLYKSFFDVERLDQATERVIEKLNDKLEENNLKNELKHYKETYEQEVVKGEYTEEELKELKKLSTKRGYKEYLKYFEKNAYLLKEYIANGLENKEGNSCNAYTRYFVYGEEIKLKQDNVLEEYKSYGFMLIEALIWLTFNYDSEIVNRGFSNVINSMIFLGVTNYLEEEMLIKIFSKDNSVKNSETAEEMIELVRYINEIKKRCELLEEKTLEEHEKEWKAQKENKATYETIPLFKFTYGDLVTVADTKLINELITKSYNKDIDVIKESNAIIESIKYSDKLILDIIVLEIYGRQNLKTFTDRNIALFLLKDNPQATITDKTLKDINDSIDRLQNISLAEGYKSTDIEQEEQAKLKFKSRLLRVDILEIDYKTKTTYYTFVTEPYYYKYAYDTGIIDTYDRDILTRDKKGIQHDIKNTTLNDYLVRRVLSLKLYDEVEIKAKDIYDILEIKDSRKYSQARKKTLELLKDLKQNYNFIYTDFKNGKARIEKVNNKPLKKEKYIKL